MCCVYVWTLRYGRDELQGMMEEYEDEYNDEVEGLEEEVWEGGAVKESVEFDATAGGQGLGVGAAATAAAEAVASGARSMFGSAAAALGFGADAKEAEL